jgi:hypothetical protein
MGIYNNSLYVLKGANLSQGWQIEYLIETGFPNSKKPKRCFDLKIIQDGVLTLN